MTHESFMRAQTKMQFALMDMKQAWNDFAWVSPYARLPYWDRSDLKDMGRELVDYGQKMLAEAERQETEKAA